MVSISAASEISKRAIHFFQELDFNNFKQPQVQLIKEFLKKEYEIIPKKERIGKGMVYISKVVAKSLYRYLKQNYLGSLKKDQMNENIINFILEIIELLEVNKETLVFSIHITANLALDFFDKTIVKIEQWATDEKWEIRENAIHPILSGLKKDRETTLKLLSGWVKSEDPNIRRLVAEALRPKAYLKWLRDPTQNDEVLALLTMLNHDESIYVRKAVGNNLKDLTKYMPEKILQLIENWLKKKGNLSQKGQKNLIWTIYQALRWLKDRNPEYHGWIEKFVGKNYILYFDEKRNRNALPPKEPTLKKRTKKGN